MPESYVSAILMSRQTSRYDIHLRDYKPLSWRGVFCLFGGHVEDGESPEKAMFRELGEETDLLKRASPEELKFLDAREYDWNVNFSKVIDRIESVFGKIPDLYQHRLDRHELEKSVSGRVNYSFLFKMREKTLEGHEVKEGNMSRLYSPVECMALIMAADDRLLLLDHFVQKGLKFR